MVAAMTAPVDWSTATTWAPKMPVTLGGDSGNESGLAGRMRPVIVPMFTASAAAG
jgi:hypothetical protein